MDSHLFYKYTDGFSSDVGTGNLTFDKSVFKTYAGRYETRIEDSVLTSLPRRLWNCKLVWTGDVDCKRFLNDLKEFWTTDDKFPDKYEDKLKEQHEFLLTQELVEIWFECY